MFTIDENTNLYIDYIEFSLTMKHSIKNPIRIAIRENDLVTKKNSESLKKKENHNFLFCFCL